MAITYISTIEHQNHREKIVFKDSYGATSHLYIQANQSANRANLIHDHEAMMSALEDTMTAFIASINGNSNVGVS